MERDRASVDALSDKYGFLFDILGATSECRAAIEKPSTNKTEESSPKVSVTGLQLIDFNLYPNPANHSVQLEFQAAKKPLEVYIHTPTGVLVYKEILEEFSGSYSKNIELLEANADILVLSIIQNGNMHAEQISLQK